MDEYTLDAQARVDFGKKSARRLRREGRLPANIYGHKQENRNVTLDSTEFRRFFEAGHRVVTIGVDGEQEHGVIKEVQFDGMGNEILHVDLTRVSRDEKIELQVQIQTIGVISNGVLNFPHHELRVVGLGHEIPERIELRIDGLKIGDVIRVKDIPVPANCEIIDDSEGTVLSVVAPKGLETEEAPAEEGAPSEPEIIGKPKEDGEAES